MSSQLRFPGLNPLLPQHRASRDRSACPLSHTQSRPRPRALPPRLPFTWLWDLLRAGFAHSPAWSTFPAVTTEDGDLLPMPEREAEESKQQGYFGSSRGTNYSSTVTRAPQRAARRRQPRVLGAHLLARVHVPLDPRPTWERTGASSGRRLFSEDCAALRRQALCKR